MRRLFFQAEHPLKPLPLHTDSAGNPIRSLNAKRRRPPSGEQRLKSLLVD